MTTKVLLARYDNVLFILFLATILIGCEGRKNTSTGLSPRIATSATVPADSLVLDQLRGVVLYGGIPFTGTAVSIYPSGTVGCQIEYVNGKKEGWYRKWFLTATLSFEATYSNGKLDGTSRSWWSNGNLRSVSNFVDGIPEGLQLEYYKSGTMFKKINLVGGKEEGLQQSWRQNGKLYNNYEAKNGRNFGLKRSKLCYQLDDEEVQY